MGVNFHKNSLLLYAVTDRSWLDNRTLYHDVEQALKGGATSVQLREKALTYDEFLKEAIDVRALCLEYNVPFIINDSVEIALLCNADGVHVGQSDMDVLKAREKLGDDKIIGVSVQTVAQAVEAEKLGADYLGVGAVFSTSTKRDADHVSYDVLKLICSAVSIPVVAIGGISAQNIEKLSGSGIDGVAVVSALFAESDIRSAAIKLRSLAEKTITR